MTRHVQAPFDANALLETAARWYERIHRRTVSPQDRAAFKQWLDESELHSAAFRSAAAVWRLTPCSEEPWTPAPRQAAACATRKQRRWRFFLKRS